MTVDGEFECYTLEPVTRPVGDNKVWGKTAIPYGTYNVTLTFSGHFQRMMPLVEDVAGFDEIRIHQGNIPANTEGCCLVGESMSKDEILKSVVAFEHLLSKIKDAINSGDTVTVEYSHD